MTQSDALPQARPDAPAGGRITHLLYLHGFRSSPQSAKARQVAARVAAQHPAVTFWCPQLPPSPREAMALAMAGIADWPRDRMAVVGSSLGGFYATHVAETLGCPAALLNPAVDPARDLVHYIGGVRQWHRPEEMFDFKAEYIDELHAIEHGPITRPTRYFAIVAKGDEVLDWREMTGRYPGADILLLEGGDHAIGDFALHMDRLFAFLDLA